jgi:single-stranded DNA-binding protein
VVHFTADSVSEIDSTEQHRVQAWAKLAEYATRFKNGAHLRVEGELRSRTYETDAGLKVLIGASSIMSLRPSQRSAALESESQRPTVPPTKSARNRR